MSTIRQYAPVTIATLNRYEHFRNCLESLEKCTGADQTEVFVALDYPPSEKYVEGWKKIDKYLLDKEQDNGFKNLFVIRRKYNYGIGKVNSNISSLFREQIADHYDRYISTEDDNVFSPNFLEYMNQALEEFYDDDNCMAVCGYQFDFTLTDYNYNIYLSHEFSAWGTGYWVRKRKEHVEFCTITNVKRILSSWKSIWTLYRHEPRLLNTLLLNVAINRPFGDTMRVCKQYLEGKCSVFPVVSKVRNTGHDGSGTTLFKINEYADRRKIDDSPHFTIDTVDRAVDARVQKALENHLKKPFFQNMITLIRVLIYWLLKVDILYYEQKRRNRSLFK